MSDGVQLITDGDGIAVIGEAATVERFLRSENLPSRELDLSHRLAPVLKVGSGATEVASALTANTGRWVKMTRESAAQVKKFGLMKDSKTGLDIGVVFAKGEAHGIKGLLRFEPGSLLTNPGLLTNPALLSGAAGIMTQVAMQQTMDEITDYLKAIDEKVDDIIRAQKDAAIADMIGVDLVIEEAMIIRDTVGRVSEVTWSKVQATALTLSRTQAYALRQLDALAEKLEVKGQMGALASSAKDAEARTREWLAVIARCFQLQDAIAVLELDRILTSTPEDLDEHRRALKAARANRLDLISRTTIQLMERMSAAAALANGKALLHPVASRGIVQASNTVATDVVDFNGRLGVDQERLSVEAKRWLTAAAEARDKLLDAGRDGAGAARRLGEDTLDRATSIFRSVDIDGDGVPDKPRARAALEDAGSSVQEAATGAVGAVGSLFRRRKGSGVDAQVRDSVEALGHDEPQGDENGE